MKKKIKVVMLCMTVLLLYTGCSPTEQSDSEVGVLDTKIVLGKDYNTFLQYADGDNTLLSLEKNIDVNVGPATTTEGFVKYGLDDGTIKQVIPVDMDAQVHSAIPFGDALLYVDYTVIQDELKWDVVLYGNGEKKVLRSGACNFYSQLPEIALIEEKPMILWEDTIENVFKLEAYDGQAFSEITLPKDLKLAGTELASNAKELCFLVEDATGKGQFVLAGKDGVIDMVPLDGKVTSFGLAKDCLVCGLGDEAETGIFSLMIYNFRLKERKEIKTSKALYRMADSQTDETLCVNSDFQILRIDSSEEKITEISTPKGYEGDPVIFGMVSENGCLAGFLKDDQYNYCIINEM